MLKYLRFLLLGVLLLFGNCRCKKLTTEGGEKPRVEEVDSNTGDSQEQIEEKVNPSFTLEPQEGSSDETYANETLQLALKETALSKTTDKIKCKIVGLYATNGELLIENKEGGDEPTKLLAEGDELIVEKGSFPLIFKPSGKVGQANISITLETEEKKKVTVKLTLSLKPASTIFLITPKEIHTGEEEKITLDITSRDPNEEFTIQSIKPGYGEVELMYASGEYVHLGDKLKPGVHQFTYKIHRRDHVEPVVTLDGYTTYKGREISLNKHESNLEISLTDNKGNEYQAKSEYKLFDWSFEIELEKVYWFERLEFGYTKFDFTIKEPNGRSYHGGSNEELDPIYGRERYKILSCKSSDGVPVTLIAAPLEWKGSGTTFSFLGLDKIETNMIGNKIRAGLHTLRFRPASLSLGIDSKITIEIEGPRGVIKELVIDITEDEQDILVDRRFRVSCEELKQEVDPINEKIDHFLHEERLWKIRWGKEEERYAKEAWEAGKKAAFILSRVEEMKDEANKVPGLKNRLGSVTLDKLERLIEAIQELEKNKEEINKMYGYDL
jgi:hypothetical protein